MLPLIRHRLTRRILFTLLFELAGLNLVIIGLLFWRTWSWESPEITGKTVAFSVSCTFVIQFVFWSFGLYSREVIYSGRRVFQSLLGAFAVSGVAMYGICYLFSVGGDPVFVPTLAFFPPLLVAAFLVIVAAGRLVVLTLFRDDTHFGKILVVGDGPAAERIIEEARRAHGSCLKLDGVVSQKKAESDAESAASSGPGSSVALVGGAVALVGGAVKVQGVPVLGAVRDLERLVRSRGIRTLILALPYDHPELPLDFLLECKMSGLNVIDATTFYESVAHKVLLERLEPVSVLYPGGYTMTRLRWIVKESFERLLAAGLLAFLSVPLALVYLTIRWTSKGSPIFRQERVGKGGKTFTLYKFRTMVVDAEKSTGAMWSTPGDPRVTRLGRFLRRTRIDELPQLFNVVRGDMAFVGPRPERPEFTAALGKSIPFYHHRHFVKPGLTGWAQVSFSYARSLDDSEEKLRYDLYYVKNMSVLFDALILLATLRAVVKGAGV